MTTAGGRTTEVLFAFEVADGERGCWIKRVGKFGRQSALDNDGVAFGHNRSNPETDSSE